MKDFKPAKMNVGVSAGESVRLIRELQELSQTKLSKLTGIPVATLSAIENDTISLSTQRARVLARALRCDARVLLAGA